MVLFGQGTPLATTVQTQQGNYIKTITYKKPTSQGSVDITEPKNASIYMTYYDGLGRPIQKIAHKQSGNGNDILTHIQYDAFGRQVKDFLPIVNGRTLDYHTIDSSTVSSYYSASAFPTMEITNTPFSEKHFEFSPLNRVFKQAAPGDDWAMGNGHEVKFDYQTNLDQDKVRLFGVELLTDYTPSLIDNSIFYDQYALYKTITKDENWQNSDGDNHTTQEFKDKEGRVVLKRTFGTSMVDNSLVNVAHDTYYVYDDYGNLTYVIPPIVDLNQAISNNILDGLCYQYKYDYRNRLIEKQLPGKQREYIAYNSQDLPVATGPAKYPWGGNEWGWLISKYDAYGRVVYTGWIGMDVNDTQRLDFESQLSTNWWENFKKGDTVTVDGVEINYTNSTFPTAFKLLTVNYYDNYDYVNAPSLPSTVENQPILQNPKTLSTGSWIRVLNNPTSIDAEISYTLYDAKGRVVRTNENNYLEGYTRVDSKLDFTGKTVYTFTYHKRTESVDEIIVKDTYEYTPQDKLLLHKQQINNLSEELIVKNDYDDLGQLITKQVGGEDITNFVGLQKVDYLYNIRGWLKSINNVDNLVESNAPTDLFAFKINYNTIENAVNHQVKELYNGNISETFWRTNSDNVLRKYGYQYDDLNRLNVAFYQKPNLVMPVTNMYNESINYDKNGNITNLRRNGDFDFDDQSSALEIDHLNYSYDTNNKNQLMRVDDSSNSNLGFKDGTNTGDDYGYDVNGNMTSDNNKEITSILYNHLNLPIEINFHGGNKIKYLYNANGQKVSKTVTIDAVETVTDYLNGYQYTNNIMNFFPHAEGYVNVTYCSACQWAY